jgi:uncharacterized protein (TIGR02246 family)
MMATNGGELCDSQQRQRRSAMSRLLLQRPLTALALVIISATAAADSKEDIVAAEKNSWKVYADRDAKGFGDTMTDDAVVISAGGEVVAGKQALMAQLSSSTCKVKSYDLADAKVRPLSADVAILTYNLTQDVTCEGGEKWPPKAFVTAVYARKGGKWLWANYQETVQE